MTKSLQTLLDSLFSNNTHWKINLLKNWPNIAGKLHMHISIEKITDTSVILVVDNSCLLQELYHLSPLLLEKINQTLDQPRIKNVRFKLKSEKKRRTKKQVQKPKLQKKIITKLHPRDTKQLAIIKDPELKKALANFRLRCYQE